ncbi:hypothetical protein OKW18_005115 [Streptomyces pratensis]|nr:hypothetical protein [Streptomyces pratensis]
MIWADRRFKLGHGRAFALYVAAYCAGRGWIEYMRVDEAHHVLGLRLNVWTAIIVFVLAVTYIVISAKVRPGREEVVEPATADPAEDGGDTATDAPAKTGEDTADDAPATTGESAAGPEKDPVAEEQAPEADGSPQKADKS